MAKMNVRMGDELLASWMSLCEKQGLVSAEEIRAFIGQRVAEQQEPTKPKVIRKKQEKHEVKLWLTTSELEDIRLRRKFNKSSRAGWIIKAVRAGLAQQPVFDDTLTQPLIDATAELNAHGRNLNQIARSLNRNEMPEKAVKFEELVERIDTFIETTQALIDIARSRGQIIT